MKKFDIEQAQAGKKVITRDGADVDILRFDLRNDRYPIVAVIDLCNGGQSIGTFTSEGETSVLAGTSKFDLFMAPEKKEGWLNIYTNKYGHIFDTEELAIFSAAHNNALATIKIEWEE